MQLRKFRFLIVFAAVFSAALSARSLTIVPTFDSSITGDANSAAMMAGINHAIQVLQSNVTDNVTVNVTFVADESIGLGQSSTYGAEFSYANFLAALRTHATSLNDTNGLSKLPNSSTDPLIGGAQIHLTTAQARVLGLDSSYSGTDSTISLKMSLMNFTRPPGDPNKYDLAQVTEHELDEVLGISSGLPDTSVVWPMDLFRYTTNLARTFTTAGDNAYFSVDGTNLLARFNMNPGGDYADFWSYSGNWAPPGLTPHPQVQDAFTGPGYAIDLGTNELAMLDVVGWTIAKTTPPLLLTISRIGTNSYKLSWPGSYTGYVLQENANLLNSAGWNYSASGAANPATNVSTAAQKFYRLVPQPNSLLRATAPPVEGSPVISHELTIRSLQPRKP